MKRLSVMLALIFLVGCVNPTTGLTLPSDIPETEVKLEVLSSSDLQPAVDVDYNLKLKASIRDAKWRLSSGLLPTGSMRLSPAGEFSGVATKLGEIGGFTVEVSIGSQTISRYFTFRVVDVVWAYPLGVQVAGFYPGARAEYTIKIHNDDSVMVERKRVGTDATDIPGIDGLITVPIPINQKLHGDISSVLAIKSDNTSEQLSVVSYKDNTLIVQGFLPLTNRIIEISYVADAMFSVSYETVDLEVGNMVTISDTSFILGPHTTKSIDVALDMPADYQTDLKEFNFRVLTGRTVSTQGQLTIAAVNAITWNVKMK